MPLPETEAVKALQEAYTAEGKGYQEGWNKEETGLAIIWVNPENPEEKKVVPEIVINPEDGNAVRTYFCEAEESGKFEVTTNYIPEEVKTKSFSAWEIKDGELVRETHKFPGLVKPEEGPTLPLYPVEEINAELALSATIATEEERIASFAAAKSIWTEILKIKFYSRYPYVTYQDMLIPLYTRQAFLGYGAIAWSAGSEYVRIIDKPKLYEMNNFNSLFTKRAPLG